MHTRTERAPRVAATPAAAATAAEQPRVARWHTPTLFPHANQRNPFGRLGPAGCAVQGFARGPLPRGSTLTSDTCQGDPRSRARRTMHTEITVADAHSRAAGAAPAGIGLRNNVLVPERSHDVRQRLCSTFARNRRPRRLGAPYTRVEAAILEGKLATESRADAGHRMPHPACDTAYPAICPR